MKNLIVVTFKKKVYELASQIQKFYLVQSKKY